jgi:hypothetical protein
VRTPPTALTCDSDLIIYDSAVACVRSVIFLRTALGSLAVPQPPINVGGAFEVAADAALGATLKPGFLPYRVASSRPA